MTVLCSYFNTFVFKNVTEMQRKQKSVTTLSKGVKEKKTKPALSVLVCREKPNRSTQGLPPLLFIVSLAPGLCVEG